MKLKKAWTAEMTQASKHLDFEKAARLRDNLSALDHMKERVSLQSIAPEGVAERLASSQGVSELQTALALDRPPYHIEAFDISHFQGKATVGSMVCFKGGTPHRDHYRRFKIKSVTGIDDFRSIREVVLRRYKRLSDTGEPLPDLVLIDGGKGQLGMAVDALNELKLRIPLAALAKREEEIFVPARSEPVVLGPDSPARQLVERLRDEAHRFAVTYHRLLRKNQLLPR
jgi:excinuclease ABC subunit C